MALLAAVTHVLVVMMLSGNFSTSSVGFLGSQRVHLTNVTLFHPDTPLSSVPDI